MKTLVRITTVPESLRVLLKGQHKFMSQYYDVIGVSADGPELEEVKQNEGIKVHVVEMTRSITPWQDLKALFKLYKFFKEKHPFIVHTHTPKAGTLGMLAAKIAGVPHRLHTIAGLPLLEAHGAKRQLLDVVERITYACSTHILPNSYGLESIILENGYTNKSKLTVIGKGSSNGIDTNHYDPALVTEGTKESLRNELKIATDDFVFIFIGRLVKDKGVNELVLAFDNISKTSKKCKLLLVGPRESHLDPLFPKTDELIANNSSILEVGHQKDIRPWVTISHVLVLPSYREGFPNVVLQASSMNLPCIVTDINGCNEIIENGVNGVIIPPKDVERLQEEMQNLLENTANCLKLSKHSRNRIIERYSQEYIWQEILNFYSKLK